MSVQGVAPDTIVDGRYRVQRRLGTGGMADVYCAEDEQLGRRVALKLLHRRFAEDAEFRERFRREAQSAASLNHPGIVGIFDRGEWDGTPYIAMELVDGRTLKDLVRERAPLAPGPATDLTEQILRAARYAHRHGIVHRDLKPQNVILDGEGTAKVADFGVARAGASEMTETGAIVGTAQYLSPEQAQGRPVSPRSDLYSIGVILYELLTGRVPFQADSPVTIALKHINDAPVPPSQLNPAVPPALEAVVLRALEKEPERRFADADEFIAALESARRGIAVAPREVVPVAPPADPVAVLEGEDRRNRWWLWLLALLLLAALAVGAYLLLVGPRRTVPKVVGLKSATAARIIQDDGFEVNIVDVVNDRVPSDRVAAQDPRPGEKVRKGSTVTLTVSTGPGEATIPVVEGQPRADAERAVRAAGFKTQIARAYSDTVPAGRVLSTTPAQGTSLRKGQRVTLTVSRGKQRIAVPSLVGKQRDAAEQALQDAGLKADVTERSDGGTSPGTVLEQDPKAGTRLAKGGTVGLVVAKAPPTVAVPDVTTGHPTEQDATQTLQDAGFQVRTRDRKVGTADEDGTVRKQRPAAGSQRRKGSTVTIYVGRFQPPAPDTTPTPTPTPSPSPTPSPTP